MFSAENESSFCPYLASDSFGVKTVDCFQVHCAQLKVENKIMAKQGQGSFSAAHVASESFQRERFKTAKWQKKLGKVWKWNLQSLKSSKKLASPENVLGIEMLLTDLEIRRMQPLDRTYGTWREFSGRAPAIPRASACALQVHALALTVFRMRVSPSEKAADCRPWPRTLGLAGSKAQRRLISIGNKRIEIKPNQFSWRKRTTPPSKPPSGSVLLTNNTISLQVLSDWMGTKHTDEK